MNEEVRAQIMKVISAELNIKEKSIQNVIELINDGNTVPFIARYRKELTGGLDEVQIRDITEKYQYRINLQTRKEEVIRLIEEQGKLTEDLKVAIEKADKLQEVEDLYRPYKQKRRTRATVAKEKGLEGLAEWLFSLPTDADVEKEASKYLSEEKEVNTIEEAISGARDIIAEWISDDADVRKEIRRIAFNEGVIATKAKDQDRDEKGVYEMYYEYEEPIKRIVPHRILAINRGEKEEILRVGITFPVDKILKLLERKFMKRTSPAATYVKEAIEDGYKRLIEPSIEREIRSELTTKAEEQAIHIFSENLKNLLLQPPLKNNIVLGVDPAYRTGCKLAVVDETGKVLAIEVIYPTPPHNEIEKGKKVVAKLVKEHKVNIIAIGNGTASRETEQFIADTIRDENLDASYIIVNEAGASVYSASELGREEFPELQVEERSAVSIARRLQDPLAELVKIDPKSVGVGQYQHDVSQKRLHESLNFVVETVVNRVGVNVNTASPSLLQYVAGLSKTVASNIVKVRNEQGRFTNRNQLKKIPRLGAKTYEQCIGFLRIQGGEHPLDETAIHPESYEDTEKFLSEIDMSLQDIGTDELRERVQAVDLEKVAEKIGVGIPTLKDIVDALIRPGRDPREDLPKPILKKVFLA